MTNIFSDNFVRANGALGANWATPVPNSVEFAGWTGTPAGGVLINNNGVGGATANGLDCCALVTGQVFGNNQWASAMIKTVAAPTAVLSITAVSFAAGNSTYTYTVTSGSVAGPITGGAFYVVVTGMQNAANNKTFIATTFGAGTFTVANASGVTESGSTGTGTVQSDVGAGVVVRGSGTSAATLNGYFFHCGCNSSSTASGNLYYRELWKVVNGVGTFLQGSAPGSLADIWVPNPGDTIALSAVGTTINAYYNGMLLFAATDASLASGVPGIWTFAVNGNFEYVYADWTSGTTAFTGNNGTTINNFIAADTGSPAAPLTTDNFAYAAGDLHAANANWAYEGSSTFVVNASGQVYPGAGQSTDFAYRSDLGSGSNLFVQTTMLIAGTDPGSTFQNCGPGLRVASGAQSGYQIQLSNNTTFTVQSVLKYISGANTSLSATAGGLPANGDKYGIAAFGGTLIIFKNQVIVEYIRDASLTSGFVGLIGAAAATVNGFSSFSGAVLDKLFIISGNAGIAGATVSFSGPTNGSVIADASGNYLIFFAGAGSYTITPSSPGKFFSPASSNQSISTLNVSGVSFSLTSGPSGGGDLGPGYDFEYRM